MAENIHLACRGWQHAGWQNSFYPDDLPVDWQLTYYSNEFDAVVIPADYWQEANLVQVIDWCDQVHAEFHFYVELPPGLSSPAAAQLCTQLEAMAGNLAAVLVGDAVQPELLALLQTRLPGLSCYRSTDCWHPDAPEAQSATAPLAMLARAWFDLRELRRWLEAFAPKQGAAKQAVLCTMAQPDALQLQQARTLLQIMGL